MDAHSFGNPRRMTTRFTCDDALNQHEPLYLTKSVTDN
jgi:hypothetical protein